MVLSDFHCHLYTYDNGFSIENILMPQKADDIRVETVFNNIREDALWKFADKQFSLSSDSPTPLPFVQSFIGIHPWDTLQGIEEEIFNRLEETAVKTGAFIGEIGLDRIHGGKKDTQLAVFTRALHIALKLEKPFSLHCVREWGHLTEELEKVKNKIRTPFMIHGFNSTPEIMKRITALGGYISFGTEKSGAFSKKAASSLLQADENFILLETDFTCLSGDSAGTDLRAKYFHALLHVYTEAAKLLGKDIEYLSGVTKENGKIFKTFTAYRQ